MPPSSILTKAMALLDLIAASRTAMTLTEIAEASGLPKSSAHRLLVHLREADALAFDSLRQTYRPGSRLLRWGAQTQTNSNLVAAATPHMKALCAKTGLRVALSVLDGAAVLFLHTVETGAPFRLAPRVGEHSPLHASAAGKIFLAGMDAKDQNKLLSKCDFEQCTEFTITDADDLREEIKRVADQGYAISAREEHRQTCGLALAVEGSNKAPLAALSLWDLGGPELLERLEAHITVVRETTFQIRKSIGLTNT